MGSQIKEGTLFGMGSPLLDISANTGEEFLTKYGLKPNDQILAEDKHLSMYHDLVNNHKVFYIAGGSTLNSIRVAQWILTTKKACIFTGCIGNDDFGNILQNKARENNVDTRFQIHETQPTGTCAVIVTENGLKRSLCAYLAASKHFSKQHLEKPENLKAIHDAQFYYIAGFFLTVCMDSILMVAKHAAEQKKVFTMNLSAPYLSLAFKKQQEQVLPYIDILFGNETEAETFAEAHNLNSTNLQVIALEINKLPKINKAFPRITVITQGKNPIIVANGNKLMEFEVEALSEDKIVDTNGAGDAFTGGFLSQLVLGQPLETCVKCGIYASREVIQNSGCTFPSIHDFQA